MRQFRIYLHKDIIIKPRYIFSYLLKLVAWRYYVILDYCSQICNELDIYCSNCIKFLHVSYLIRSGLYQVGISIFSFNKYTMQLMEVRNGSCTE